MRCLHAYARARAGLGRLTLVGKLDASARLKSQLIVRCRSFSHTPCGRAIEATFRAVRYGSSSWKGGENLAWGAGSMGSARATFARWLASPAHRPNIVDGSWRDLGVDLTVARGLFGLDRVNVWVAHFGKP
jgi:uncharacterized protein YkwD